MLEIMFLLFFGVLYSLYAVASWCLARRRARQRLAQLAAPKLARAKQQADFIAQQCRQHHLEPSHIRDIVNLPSSELLSALARGDLSAERVTLAFCARAQEAHSRLNCLTEQCMERALDEARARDAARERGERGVGRLHGLPVSFKDSVGVAGLDCTLGVTQYIGQPFEDCLLVKLLLGAGAVPYTKTNVPQTLLSYECRNPLWGVTRNSWNPAYTPGGSSGGEGALLAERGSVLGVGTDIGGSVRIPAAFSGVFALKPTWRRVTRSGFRSSVPGQEAVPGVSGPMACDVELLARFMEVVCVKEAWDADHELVPLPFDRAEYESDAKLRVGFYTGFADNLFEPSPPCQRAVREAVAALEAAGHEVVEFDVPDAPHAYELFMQLMTADAVQSVTDQLQDEVWEDFVTAGFVQLRAPQFVRRLVGKIVGNVLGWKTEQRILSGVGRRTTNEVWKLQGARSAYRQRFFEAVRALDLDVVLSPAHVYPSVEHHAFKDVSFAASYTMLYNLLDLPAGVVPITHVRSDEQYTSRPHGMFENKMHRWYDAKKAAGLPVAVQIASLPFKEERVLRAMRVLADLCPFDARPEHRQ